MSNQPQACHLRQIDEVNRRWNTLYCNIENIESELFALQEQMDQLTLKKSQLIEKKEATMEEMKAIGRENNELLALLFPKK